MHLTSTIFALINQREKAIR